MPGPGIIHFFKNSLGRKRRKIHIISVGYTIKQCDKMEKLQDILVKKKKKEHDISWYQVW